MNDKSDRTVDYGEQQDEIDEGDVVGDQERSSLLRDVLMAHDPEPIQGVRGQDQQQAQQDVGKQGDRPEHSRRDRQCRHQQDGDRGEPQSGKARRSQRSRRNPSKNPDVCQGDYGSAMLVGSPPLEQGVQRHDDHAAGHAQGGRKSQQAVESRHDQCQQQAVPCHQDGAQRDHAVFDLAPGEAGGDQAAPAHSQSEQRQRDPRMSVGKPQHRLDVDQDVLSQETRDGPVDDRPGYGQSQNALLTDGSPCRADGFSQVSFGTGRRHRGKPQGDEEPHHRRRNQDRRRKPGRLSR